MENVEVLVYLTANIKRGGMDKMMSPAPTNHGVILIRTTVTAVHGIVAFTVGGGSTLRMCLS